MKKLILAVIALWISVVACAQNSPTMITEPIIPRNPNIIYKPDTVQYVVGNYKVSADSLITALLVKMEGIEVGRDKSVWFQGKQVDKVKINGRYWKGLNVLKAVTTILVGMVENIQMIDDYGDAPSIHPDMEPEEVLNINIKKNATAYIGSLLTLGQRKPASSLGELLKKLQSLDIDTSGILMYKGKPVTRITLLDTVKKPKVIYKPDTMLYQATQYKMPKNNSADGLLKAMEGFEFNADGSIWHQGLQVKKFTINGRLYDSLELSATLKKITADAIVTIEMIDDYSNVPVGDHWKWQPEKLLNINIPAIKLTEIEYLLSNNSSITINGQKHTIIRMDCRDYASERLGPIMASIGSTTEPDIDDYGDQIPHFLIQPKQGTYTSKATKY